MTGRNRIPAALMEGRRARPAIPGALAVHQSKSRPGPPYHYFFLALSFLVAWRLMLLGKWSILNSPLSPF
jgi:hypothetical protein